MSLKKIAVIPARGGSKRIPKKNILDFMGKPMIAWAIESAIRSEVFDRVLVSTDDENIAEISIKYGAEVPFLRQEFGDDQTPVSMATIHALEQTEDYYNESFDEVVQLMANCPIRRENNILDAYNYFKENEHNFQISCFKFGWMNPWWAMKLDNENKSSWMFEEATKKRSQDLDDLYCPTGSIWIANVAQLKTTKTFYGEGFKMCPMDWKAAVDIDDYEDLEFAKAVYHIVK